LGSSFCFSSFLDCFLVGFSISTISMSSYLEPSAAAAVL
jgi:hypothetical protein